MIVSFKYGEILDGSFSIRVADIPLDPMHLNATGDSISEEYAQKIILDGSTAYRFGAGDGPCGGEVVDVALGDKSLRFDFGTCFDEPKLEPGIITQILSTFRFLE